MALMITLDDAMDVMDRETVMLWLEKQIDAQQTILNEQDSVIEALKSDLNETLEVLVQKPEVVLCKDCKHGEPFNEDVFCTKEIGTIESSVHKQEWFCADGERKSNGND